MEPELEGHLLMLCLAAVAIPLALRAGFCTAPVRGNAEGGEVRKWPWAAGSIQGAHDCLIWI